MMFAKFVRALAIGIAIGIAIGLAIGAPTLAQAQQLIGSYVARLSEADHFNSSGQRLTSAAAIIRQDRANFHRFGIKDAQDEGDDFFADEGNRAALEQMLETRTRGPRRHRPHREWNAADPRRHLSRRRATPSSKSR